jgi:hypothetical protein
MRPGLYIVDKKKGNNIISMMMMMIMMISSFENCRRLHSRNKK